MIVNVIAWIVFTLPMNDRSLISKSKNCRKTTSRLHVPTNSRIQTNRLNKYNQQFCDNKIKKKRKKQREIQNRLAPVLVALVHCLPKCSNELLDCCNLKRINPKAIYYMVIALQPISINTNQKTKITFITRNRKALGLYGKRMPRQHWCHQSI